jgi:hypothetical protein
MFYFVSSHFREDRKILSDVWVYWMSAPESFDVWDR